MIHVLSYFKNQSNLKPPILLLAFLAQMWNWEKLIHMQQYNYEYYTWSFTFIVTKFNFRELKIIKVPRKRIKLVLQKLEYSV